MPGPGKGGKEKPKTTQSKLTDYGPHGEHTASQEANAASKDANVSSQVASTDTDANVDAHAVKASAYSNDSLHSAKDEILGELRGLRTEFVGKFDRVLKALEDTRKEMSECAERLSQAEVRLSAVEDQQVDSRVLIESLQRRNKSLEDKVIDMEMRSRLNNLRLVGLPESSEGADMCGFLENWLPDALDLSPMRQPLVLERAHRIGPKRDTDTPPRTVIMRFLNYKQKEMVFRAAKT